MSGCRSYWWGGALSLAFVGYAVDAPAREVAGTINLGLEGTLFGVETITLTDPSDTSVTATETNFGLAGGGFGPGVGFGLSNTLVLGMRLQFMNSARTFENDYAPATTSTAVQFTGTLEVLLGGDSVKPFLGPKIGFRSISAESGGVEASSSLFMFGAVAGLHGFLVDAISIDPTVSLLGVAGSETVGDVDFGRSGFAFVGGLALTGWFGGSARERPDDAEVPDRYSSQSAVNAQPAVSNPQATNDFEDGIVRASVQVAEDMRGVASITLLLEGDQSVAGSEVKLKVLMSEPPEDEACESVRLLFGRKAKDLRLDLAGNVARGSSRVYLVDATTDLGQLFRVARRKGSVYLEVCGQKLELRERPRALIKRFATDVKRLRTAIHGASAVSDDASDEAEESEPAGEAPSTDAPGSDQQTEPAEDAAAPGSPALTPAR